MSLREKNTHIIKTHAARLGFDFCGIAKVHKLEEEEFRLEKWLQQGMHGEMAYMANHFEKRLDPVKLVPGAKSVITFIYNYYPEKELTKTGKLRVAKYAYGKDYHYVIKEKLKLLVHELDREIGEIEGRVFVDSAPVMERAWAARSGIGWIGKNSLLLNRNMGSFFFLAVLISDLELVPDSPTADYCGTCTKCMDACPTDAIPEPYIVDASKCISYLTIELKNEIPEEFKGKFDDWIFGCDICQDVCPWNRFARPHKEKDFYPSPEFENLAQGEFAELTSSVFKKVFKNSALKRAGFKGLKRSIDFVGRLVGGPF